eukprot:SAG11_NODE_25_length_23789_cov_23.813592_5_plen_294_part_00
MTIYDSDGEELAHDDDGGVGTQALLEWTAPSTDVYTVEVRGYSTRQTGSYELDIDEGDVGPCTGGVTLTQPNGAIAFSDSYEDRATCTWTIECPYGTPTFSYEAMATEANFDFVNIYDGDTTADRLSHDSGSMNAVDRPIVPTSSGMATVEFTSDGSVQGDGFDMSYTCNGGGGRGGGRGGGTDGGSCFTIRVDTAPAQGIVSGGVPSLYCFAANAGETYELTVDLDTLRDSVMVIQDSTVSFCHPGARSACLRSLSYAFLARVHMFVSAVLAVSACDGVFKLTSNALAGQRG